LGIKEEVELDEIRGQYLELDFKDKNAAIAAYKLINNKIYAGGTQPFQDFNQEGNSLQFDSPENSKQIIKDLKDARLKFKVAVDEEVDLDENFGVHKDIPAMEVGTDRYRDYVVGLTPGEGNPEWAKARDFKVQSMRESLIKIWEKAEKQDEDEDEKIAPVKGKKTMTGGAVAKVETKPKLDG
jgi:hypothetical protein